MMEQSGENLGQKVESRRAVGWVSRKRYPTRMGAVGFRASTQPTMMEHFGENLGQKIESDAGSPQSW